MEPLSNKGDEPQTREHQNHENYSVNIYFAPLDLKKKIRQITKKTFLLYLNRFFDILFLILNYKTGRKFKIYVFNI